ncbi:hypothetical protein [Schaalia hyovaginalis]|uniref:Uncharacterized protein n=1 Tax=Schaalia hyovaginalis TaxID=29316 RepID=A0A923IZW4_9ACTO|nr:hypothetical protein [Schaalia hyovaginalis]MBB6335194.1 hypothetical protein [Schaalia hyovaginalis]
MKKGRPTPKGGTTVATVKHTAPEDMERTAWHALHGSALRLAETTGRTVAEGTRGRFSSEVRRIVERLDILALRLVALADEGADE